MHLIRAMRARTGENHVALSRASRGLADPRLAIAAYQQTLDDRFARLVAFARASLVRRRDAISRAQHRLAYLHPRAVIGREHADLARTYNRLGALWSASFERRVGEVGYAAARLDALSPLKVLARGYAIATRDDGQAVRTAGDVRAGDSIHVRVLSARIEANVTQVEPLDDSS